jgi:predicted TPR repeat methyltransferase
VKGLAKRSARLVHEAVAAHQARRFAEARTLYKKALACRPDDPDALHFFGVLRHDLGESAAAVELIERSLRSAPGNAHAWLNLGNVLLALDRSEQARAAYERAAAAAPNLADAWYNLGFCLRKLEDAPAAIVALDRAIGLRPAHPPSFYQRGIARRECGNLAGAESDYRTALAQNPGYIEVYESLGMLLFRTARFADAASVYRTWLAAEPDSSVAAHMLAATSGEHSPERASAEYVTETFDRFAPTFEQNLQGLGYRAPDLVKAALSEAMRTSPGAVAARAQLHSVLDAGCGTGLCGALLRTIAGVLTGVDLSSAMIAVAREKGCYDELHVADLCEFLPRHPRRFDAVVAADTLNYFGALEAPLRGAAASLKAGGLLVFTLERMADEGLTMNYRLEPHGRYSHRLEYVHSALAAAGFVLHTVNEQVLRRERGEDVAGLVVTAIRAVP